MSERPSDDIDPKILGLLDELDVARNAYDAAIAQGDQSKADQALEQIKRIAAKIDRLRLGGGEDTKDVANKFTEH